jgi:hypothetical protein
VSLWRIQRLEFRPRELDFRSSDQGRRMTISVVADGTEIINALDLVDAKQDPMQTIVCEACGYPGCNGGNRVVVRRLGDGILLLPAFDAMAAGSWELTEYAPPYFVAKHGSAFLADGALATLARRIPVFADPDRWPPLTVRECVCLLQWEAPAGIVGAFPDRPRLREAAIAAASHGTGREAFDALEDAIAASWQDARPAKLVPGESVYFYLDEVRHPAWEPLTFADGRYRLALAPGVGVEPADG